jgi:hypothetical protein
MANIHDDVAIENPDTLHEESDVNIRAILKFGVGLFVVAVTLHILIYVLFVFLSRAADRASAVRAYPLSVGQEDRLPPEPRLQSNPRQDLQDLRAAEDRILNGYRWVDRNAGVVGIPVNEAMKLVLQRGLPARLPAGAQPAPAAGGRQSSSGTPRPAAGNRGRQ